MIMCLRDARSSCRRPQPAASEVSLAVSEAKLCSELFFLCIYFLCFLLCALLHHLFRLLLKNLRLEKYTRKAAWNWI